MHRPEVLVLEAGLPAGPQKTLEILVASTRLKDGETGKFTNGRSHIPNYQSVTLGLAAGEARQVNFPVVRDLALQDTGFEVQLAKVARAGKGEVLLFVHGFKTPHHAAIERLAQIYVGAGMRGAAVAFTWPSRGNLFDYVTDRESALFSRDRLAIVLRQIAKIRDVKQINILAHSMGSFLTMETLRTAKLAGDGEFSGKLGTVVLGSPDIDLDVFRTQLEVIGRRSRPTVLLISQDDSALGASRFLAGNVERLGAVDIHSPEAQAEILRLGLTVIDLTKVKADSHAKFVELPLIVQAVGNIVSNRSRSGISGAIEADATGRLIHENR